MAQHESTEGCESAKCHYYYDSARYKQTVVAK